MKFFYIDESEGPGKTEFDDLYILTALMLDEQQLRVVEADLRTLAVKVFGNDVRKTGVEFHGYDIYQGKGFFKGMPAKERIEVANALIEIILKNDIGIGFACINKRKCYARLHPHQLAFLFLVERIEDLLKGPGQLGLIVADENEAMEQRLVDDLELFKTASTSFGWRPTKIEHVADSIHFVRSHHNRIIQLADVACSIIMRGRADQDRLLQRFIYGADPDCRPPKMSWPQWLAQFGKPNERVNIEMWNRIGARCYISKDFP